MWRSKIKFPFVFFSIVLFFVSCSFSLVYAAGGRFYPIYFKYNKSFVGYFQILNYSTLEEFLNFRKYSGILIGNKDWGKNRYFYVYRYPLLFFRYEDEILKCDFMWRKNIVERDLEPTGIYNIGFGAIHEDDIVTVVDRFIRDPNSPFPTLKYGCLERVPLHIDGYFYYDSSSPRVIWKPLYGIDRYSRDPEYCDFGFYLTCDRYKYYDEQKTIGFYQDSFISGLYVGFNYFLNQSFWYIISPTITHLNFSLSTGYFASLETGKSNISHPMLGFFEPEDINYVSKFGTKIYSYYKVGNEATATQIGDKIRFHFIVDLLGAVMENNLIEIEMSNLLNDFYVLFAIPVTYNGKKYLKGFLFIIGKDYIYYVYDLNPDTNISLISLAKSDKGLPNFREEGKNYFDVPLSGIGYCHNNKECTIKLGIKYLGYYLDGIYINIRKNKDFGITNRLYYDIDLEVPSEIFALFFDRIVGKNSENLDFLDTFIYGFKDSPLSFNISYFYIKENLNNNNVKNYFASKTLPAYNFVKNVQGNSVYVPYPYSWINKNMFFLRIDKTKSNTFVNITLVCTNKSVCDTISNTFKIHKRKGTVTYALAVGFLPISSNEFVLDRYRSLFIVGGNISNPFLLYGGFPNILAFGNRLTYFWFGMDSFYRLFDTKYSNDISIYRVFTDIARILLLSSGHVIFPMYKLTDFNLTQNFATDTFPQILLEDIEYKPISIGSEFSPITWAMNSTARYKISLKDKLLRSWIKDFRSIYYDPLYDDRFRLPIDMSKVNLIMCSYFISRFFLKEKVEAFRSDVYLVDYRIKDNRIYILVDLDYFTLEIMSKRDLELRVSLFFDKGINFTPDNMNFYIVNKDVATNLEVFLDSESRFRGKWLNLNYSKFNYVVFDHGDSIEYQYIINVSGIVPRQSVMLIILYYPNQDLSFLENNLKNIKFSGYLKEYIKYIEWNPFTGLPEVKSKAILYEPMLNKEVGYDYLDPVYDVFFNKPNKEIILDFERVPYYGGKIACILTYSLNTYEKLYELLVVPFIGFLYGYDFVFNYTTAVKVSNKKTYGYELLPINKRSLSHISFLTSLNFISGIKITNYLRNVNENPLEILYKDYVPIFSQIKSFIYKIEFNIKKDGICDVKAGEDCISDREECLNESYERCITDVDMPLKVREALLFGCGKYFDYDRMVFTKISGKYDPCFCSGQCPNGFWCTNMLCCPYGSFYLKYGDEYAGCYLLSGIIRIEISATGSVRVILERGYVSKYWINYNETVATSGTDLLGVDIFKKSPKKLLYLITNSPFLEDVKCDVDPSYICPDEDTLKEYIASDSDKAFIGVCCKGEPTLTRVSTSTVIG